MIEIKTRAQAVELLQMLLESGFVVAEWQFQELNDKRTRAYQTYRMKFSEEQ